MDIIQPLDLKGNPWFTSITESKVKSSGTLYLHYFYFTRSQSGQKTFERKHIRFKVLESFSQLSQLDQVANVEEMIKTQKRGFASQLRAGSPDSPSVVSSLATSASITGAAKLATGFGVPYKRLFITLAAPDRSWLPTMHLYACINVEMTPGHTPDKYDYIALADHYPQNAKDYIGNYCWQYVQNLGPEGYITNESCMKQVNMNFQMADFSKLEKLYIFYAGWVDGAWKIIGEPVSFKAQEHWMENTMLDIGQKRLHEIAIPGAHDAGTFDLYAKGFTINAQAQNMDFLGQLTYGIRFFDCRLQKWAGYNPAYYFYHGGAYSWTTIVDLTTALKTFFGSDKSQDIVILNFTHFDAFLSNQQTNDYTTLFNYFKQDTFLSSTMMTPDEAKDLTIAELRSLGKRLLILVGDEDANVAPAVEAARIAFNLGKSIAFTPQWAETHDINYLKTFLDNQVQTNSGLNKMWSLQAILTPRAADSLAWWAQELYPVLRKWMINEWWNKVNVVMCDFSGGTDIVHAAIECNRLRRIAQKVGNMYWYQDLGWQGGNGALSSEVEIGQGGWMDFKSVFAAGNGQIFAIDWNGALKHYDDTHWQQAIPMSLKQPTVIASSGWQNYRQTFASSNGNIYAITGNFLSYGTGKLLRWKPTGPNNLGQETLIDAGWENYRFGFASDNGWIYAVTGNYMMAGVGKLVKYKDTGSNKLEEGVIIDAGWEKYRLAFASGNGMIYAVDSNGGLWRWHDTGGAKLGNGTLVSTAWSNVRMATATSDGRLYAIF
jgi:hypothetical protein